MEWNPCDRYDLARIKSLMGDRESISLSDAWEVARTAAINKIIEYIKKNTKEDITL